MEDDEPQAPLRQRRRFAPLAEGEVMPRRPHVAKEEDLRSDEQKHAQERKAASEKFLLKLRMHHRHGYGDYN